MRHLVPALGQQSTPSIFFFLPVYLRHTAHFFHLLLVQMFESIHHFQQLVTFDISDGLASMQIRNLPAGSSCVGANSCGELMNTAPSDTAGLYFGATHLQAVDNNHARDYFFGGKGWLSDDYGYPTYTSDATAGLGGVGTLSGGMFLLGSNQGMYSSYSTINAFWSDTTAMDNLRGADITNSSIAGSTETIGYNTQANEVRGGHSVHSKSSESYDTV